MSGGANNFNKMTLPGQVKQGYGQALTGLKTSAEEANNWMNRGGNAYANAGSLATTNLDPYMNPYQKAVTGQMVTDINRQEDIQRLAMEDRAEAQGAFGGDRQFLMQQNMNKDFDKTRADAIARGYSDNFTNAQQAAQGDINTRLAQAGGMLNTGQGIGSAGVAAAGQGASIAGQGFDMTNSMLDRQARNGGIIQQLQQQIIDAGRGQATGWANSPASGLETLLKGLSGVPGGLGTTTSRVPSGKSPMGVVGQGLSLAGGK